MQELQLFKKDGVTVVSSRVVAKDFGKEHYHVMDKIEEKLTHEKLRVKNWFIESTFEHKGNEYKEYLLTRDGFSFIVMGFNGSAADHFKIKYIEEFNKMEQGSNYQLPADLNLVQNMIIASVKSVGETIAPVIANLENKVDNMENQISEVLDKVTINSRQKVKLINHLKNRLTVLTGETVNAEHYTFRVIKQQLFKEYQVRKWEELTVTQFDYIFADIDSMDDFVY